MFLQYEKFRKVKEMEIRFPDFLRDITEHVRAGLPLYKAIIHTSKIDYGELSKEVKLMSNQLSWGIPLDKVMKQFGERVKSKKLKMAIYTLRESYLSGGDIPSTLEALADSLATLEDAEKERKSLINRNVVIMYAISLIFIGIVVALNKFMIPIFKMGIGGVEITGLGNPCDTCSTQFSCGVCSFYSMTSSAFGIKGGIASYYVGLFFLMSMVQALCAGLIIGQISGGSVKAGFIHSIILMLVNFGCFGILSYLGLLV
jgi:flagellar protein FlaJ